MERIDGKTMDLIQQNIDDLKKLFPEIVSEGKINFDQLRLLLGDEVETGKEKYEFTWPGKRDCILLAQQQSTGTLRPDKESSKNWDTTQNLYIEGDNLEVLRLLQKSYHKKVKMIYIDPPYNTGNEFVYKDDFRDNVKNYKEKTEQTMKANPATAGRYHSDWLNMMYPRIRLAKNLLDDDGAIFISIDDNEVHNLRKICDEIFGEENFVACVVWERAYAPVNLKKHFSESHDYALCYAKSIDNLVCNGLRRTNEANDRYKNPDNDPRGIWKSDNLSVGPAIKEKVYEIITPSGRRVMPPIGYCWRLSKERFKEFVDDNRIWFGTDGNNVPSIKRFLNEVKDGMTPMTIWKYSEVGHSQDAKQKLVQLFDGKAVFDYPKSVNLIKRMVELYTSEESIVLDFFSGSSTTAHAVMQLNAEDGGNRKFIMVQLPEPCSEDSEVYRAGYNNISEIGKERIRRAGEKIKEENKDQEGIENLDIGFRVFKLDTSNLKAWDPEVENIEETLQGFIEPIKEDRTQEDLLFEIMLKYGVELTMPIEEILIKGKKAYSIGLGYMIVCLEDGLTLDVFEAIGALKQGGQEVARVVFRDSGFADDNVKTNAVQLLKKFGIEDFRTI